MNGIQLHIVHDTTVDTWICARHYLRSTPAGAVIRMRFDDNRGIIGGMLWGHPTARALDQKTLLELTRMYFVDATEAYVESKCLAMARKHIRKYYPRIKGLIAYSSTGAGHEGIIYQADNWYNLGRSKSRVKGWTSRPNREDRDLSVKIRWTRSV